jgi:hypothetical protein
MTEMKMLSIDDTAQLMGTTPLNVLMHIKRHLLEGIEVNGTWMVESQSLEILLAKTGGIKGDAVCASGCTKKHACSMGCG